MRSLAPEVTEGPRADILRCVQRFPGVHLRSIERRTGLPLGQVLYHLDRLERMGLVASVRDAGFRRFYANGDVGRAEKKYIAALRHDVPRHVVLLLLDHPGSTHKELQARLDVAGSTLSFHLQRLVEAGVLVREPEGTANRYRLVEPELARRQVVFYRESFQDERVDDYVRRQLQRLPPPPVAEPAAAPAAGEPAAAAASAGSMPS